VHEDHRRACRIVRPRDQTLAFRLPANEGNPRSSPQSIGDGAAVHSTIVEARHGASPDARFDETVQVTPPLHDDFDGAEIDRAVWLPHYLPAWSSLDRTVADWIVDDSALTLRIPFDHPTWCEEEHPEPLRVSGVQSGNRSGPVGSTDGQQRFKDDLLVRESQPRFAGWLTESGRVEIRLRLELSARSMGAMWLAGYEERTHDAGEICVVEVFGRSIDPGRSAEVGTGVKAVNDPRLIDDFAAPRHDLDVAEYHTYGVEWDASAARFEVDGLTVRNCLRPPVYPMQIMIALFDFPAWGPDLGHQPSMSVDWVRGDPA
jgi:hypothetical protein